MNKKMLLLTFTCFMSYSGYGPKTTNPFVMSLSWRVCLRHTRSGLGCLIFNRSVTSQRNQGPRLEAKCWQVSSYGRLCSRKGIISHGSLRQSGYFAFNAFGENFLVHRAVALHFLGPPPSDVAWQVHHRDGNPSNNHLLNLEYVSRSQNAHYFYANEGKACRAFRGLKVSKPVMWRVAGSQSWTPCPSIKQAAADLGMSQKTVSKCCHSSTPCKGYELRFGEDEAEHIDGEEWREMVIPSTMETVPGRQVSSHGRLRLLSGRVSSGWPQNHGYRSTSYYVSRQIRVELVHRLVVAAFLGKPPSSSHTQVNHKDGNRHNNALQNLEYVTPAENAACRSANAKLHTCAAGMKSVESGCRDSDKAWTLHPPMKSASNMNGTSIGNTWAGTRALTKQSGGSEYRLAATLASVQDLDEEWCDVDFALLHKDKDSRR